MRVHQLAKELDLKITKDISKTFNHKFRTTKNILEAGYDVQKINLKKLNAVFKKHKIPMAADFKKISEIKDIDKFILSNLKKGNDLAILFLWKAFGHKVKWGHYVLISSYNPKDKTVEVCDTSPKNKSFWTAKISKFISGMQDKWDGKERGIFIFKKLK